MIGLAHVMLSRKVGNKTAEIGKSVFLLQQRIRALQHLTVQNGGLPFLSQPPQGTGRIKIAFIQTPCLIGRGFFIPGQSFFPSAIRLKSLRHMVIHRRFPGHDTPALMVIFRIFQRFFQESYGILILSFPQGASSQLNIG